MCANIGESTCSSINGSSIAEYLLTHMNNLNCIPDFTVAKPNEFSAPYILSFNIHTNNSCETEQCETINQWEGEKEEPF
jgi:hypothetical protein